MSIRLLSWPWRRPIAFRQLAICSIANDNRSFEALFRAQRPLWGRSTSRLALGEQVLTSEWCDAGDGSRWTSFRLDEAGALALGAHFRVPVRRREPRGQQIRAEWSAKGATVRLRLINDGETVGLWDGGFPEGHLSFQVGDGVARSPGFYSGPVWFGTFERGAERRIEYDLRHLRHLRPALAPGLYRVACRYADTVYATDSRPAWPEQAHLAWHVVLEGELQVELPEAH